MTYVYRISVEYPDSWADSGMPDAVQDARDLSHVADISETTNRVVADRAAEFWRKHGALVEVRKSNPVTWPARVTP